MNEKTIRAIYDEQTITVYQAYNSTIAAPAIKAQTFVSPPFKMERMTWIKPSFLWMMYRSGWARKVGQERVLAIQIKREGFHWALDHACLSHFDAEIHASKEAWRAQLKVAPVRIQWDPERNILMEKLPYRSLQMGLSGEGVQRYVEEWIVGVQDVTDLCHRIHGLVKKGSVEEAQALLPSEKIYEVLERAKNHKS